ncbi:unnamed protein product [Choristocarpus tenellus]
MKSSDSSRNSKIFRPLLQIGHRSDYTPGVDWSFVIGTPIVQAAILAVSLAAAGATLRAQLWSALHVSLRGVLLGAVSCLPPMALGLVLDKTKWDWVERMNASTREATLLLFGSKRLLWQVLPASIALGAVIGFLEECTFRGLLPMFIMLKAKMIPTAGIVAICSTIFGVRHDPFPVLNLLTKQHLVSKSLSCLFSLIGLSWCSHVSARSGHDRPFFFPHCPFARPYLNHCHYIWIGCRYCTQQQWLIQWWLPCVGHTSTCCCFCPVISWSQL